MVSALLDKVKCKVFSGRGWNYSRCNNKTPKWGIPRSPLCLCRHQIKNKEVTHVEIVWVSCTAPKSKHQSEKLMRCRWGDGWAHLLEREWICLLDPAGSVPSGLLKSAADQNVPLLLNACSCSSNLDPSECASLSFFSEEADRFGVLRWQHGSDFSNVCLAEI